MAGMGFPGTGCGPPDHNPMNPPPNYVSHHMMKPMGMEMAPPAFNPCATGACCGNACSFDCLCHLIDSDSKGIEVDDIYQVLGRDTLKSGVLDDIDLYLECNDDNMYNKAMPPKPGIQQVKPRNVQEQYKFKFSFPNNSTPPASDSKKSFVCEYCSQSFIKDHLLKNHQAKAHNVKDLFPCPQCSYRGQQHAHLQKHIKRMHKKSSQSTSSQDQQNDPVNPISVQKLPDMPPAPSPDVPVQGNTIPQMIPAPSLQQPCNNLPNTKPPESWPAVPDSGMQNTGVQGNRTAPGPSNAGNSGMTQPGLPVKNEAYTQPSPHPPESHDQKVPVSHNRQQSTPTRNLTAPSPSRSMPECSPRPGSRQSGDFSILDISNNTFKTNPCAYVPGESLLSQLESTDGLPSPNAYPSSSPRSGLPPPSPLAHQLKSGPMINSGQGTPQFGTAGIRSGQNFSVPPSGSAQGTPGMGVGQSFSMSQGGPPCLNNSQNFTATSPPAYSPRVAPTPPEMSDLSRHKVSPAPHSGRNSVPNAPGLNQGFLCPSPSAGIPRIAPTPPDGRPQMSPMSQPGSQHSSPSISSVNQGFLSPSPPVSQPKVVPTPPDPLMRQKSPTFPPARNNPFANANIGNSLNVKQGFQSQSSPGCFPRAAPPLKDSPVRHQMAQMGMYNMQGSIPGTGQYENPRLEIPHTVPGHPYGPRPQAPGQHIVNMGLNPNAIPHTNQPHPGHGFHPQNSPSYQGQFHMSGQPVRSQYGGPGYIMNISPNGPDFYMQRSDPNMSSSMNPAYYPSAEPRNTCPYPNYMDTAASGYQHQTFQGQMYQPQQHQHQSLPGYDFQRHPYLVNGGRQPQGMHPQGNTMQSAAPSVMAGPMNPGHVGYRMQQGRQGLMNMPVNPGQPTQNFNAPYKTVGYISQEGRRKQECSEFSPPVSRAQRGEVNMLGHGQPVGASGMMNFNTQGSTLGAVTESNICQQSPNQPGLVKGTDPHCYEGGAADLQREVEKDIKAETVAGESVGIPSQNTCEVQGEHSSSESKADTKDSAIKEVRKTWLGREENSASGVPAETMEICEKNLAGDEKGTRNEQDSRKGDMSKNDNGNLETSTDGHPGGNAVDEKIGWLLLQCGVNRPSDDKSGNPEVCRLEIKTSEEEIGPVVHIMETQEIDGEVESVLDSMSQDESDAGQSDSILPVISPQMSDEIFSPGSNSIDNSPPKLSKIESVHSERGEVKCDQCDFVCADKQLLKSHERHCHDPNRKTYKCGTCSVELKQKGSFESHMARHNGERRFKCTVCHKAFVNQVSLNVHLKTHNSERPFRCETDDCNKAFRTRSDLNEHVNVVHGEKVHKCSYPQCDKVYSLEKDLRAHQVSHTLAHKCSWPRCRKTFRDKFNLNNHYKTHTKEKTIQCSHCDFKCIQKSSLDSHLKKHHPGNA